MALTRRTFLKQAVVAAVVFGFGFAAGVAKAASSYGAGIYGVATYGTTKHQPRRRHGAVTRLLTG